MISFWQVRKKAKGLDLMRESKPVLMIMVCCIFFKSSIILVCCAITYNCMIQVFEGISQFFLCNYCCVHISDTLADISHEAVDNLLKRFNRRGSRGSKLQESFLSRCDAINKVS